MPQAFDVEGGKQRSGVFALSQRRKVALEMPTHFHTKVYFQTLTFAKECCTIALLSEAI